MKTAVRTAILAILVGLPVSITVWVYMYYSTREGLTAAETCSTEECRAAMREIEEEEEAKAEEPELRAPAEAPALEKYAEAIAATTTAPAAEKTAWVSYQSDACGCKFSHPKGWTVAEDKARSAVTVSPGPGKGGVVINYGLRSMSAAALRKEAEAKGAESVEIIETAYRGYSIILVSGRSTGSRSPVSAHMIIGGLRFSLVPDFPPEDAPSRVEAFSTILKSFRPLG